MNFPQQKPISKNPSKYKTILCKHFTSQRGCFFGDNCQFAHGLNDLRTNPNLQNISSENKKGPNLQNYKIVKCKYWEKDGTCRYGTLCTFAHGEQELRTKSDNIAYAQNEQINNQMYPMMQNPFLIGFDPNVMNNMNMINYPDPNIMNNMFLGMNNVNNMNVNPNLGMNLIGNQIEEKKEEKESMDN